ncbi:hypothetical protein I302_100401 [Kwoniella bestiolae CBS 10118]|uniref:Uncharacterized protein n=1 Tax=Kwoniella bestiolae CBS 10118 TaxID=1296100 RepID=A0A1B9G518_9TREE|nr:hypothetical protein I302_03775 [Kwoniella bestiolae CBS 10118]OCF26098.1 hypothetical protein I302_03775 [Kwoniella bestiolae CBS 10118]
MPYPTISRLLLDHPYHLKGSIGISDQDDGWMNLYVQYVNTLKVEYHDPTWCHSWTVGSPPYFPNLHTLRMTYNDDGLAASIHPGYPSRACRLLGGISPTSVVLDMPSLDGMSPIALPGSISRSVNDLTFIFGQRGCLTRHDKCRFDEDMLASLTLQRITMVFPPTIKSDEEEEDQEESRRGSISSYVISILMAFEPSPITIVNAGYDEKMGKGSSHLSMKILDRKGPEMFKRRLEAMCKAHGWCEERIRKRQDTLRFLTMDEWAERSEMWDSKVERERVMRWKEVMGRA